MVASCEHIPSFVFHESRVTQLLCVHERARRRSDAVVEWLRFKVAARIRTERALGRLRAPMRTEVWGALIPSALEVACERFSLLCERFWVRKWGRERWHLSEPLSAFVCHGDKVERRAEESGQPCLPHQSPLPGSASSKCTYVTDPAASGLYNSFTFLFKDYCCDKAPLIRKKQQQKEQINRSPRSSRRWKVSNLNSEPKRREVLN